MEKHQMLIGDKMSHYRQEIVHHIAELVKIRSVQEDGEPGKPFGNGVNRALSYMLTLADSMGFQTANIDGYAGHAEYGSGESLSAILVHLDTVHEGAGWSYPPFGGLIEEGKIIGRGASDNKGPAVVALFCMKAIRDLGLPICSRIRIIFGTNEESGMQDMDYYFSKEPQPDFAFVPDAGYPIFNVEMGNVNVAISHTTDRQFDQERIPIVNLAGGVPMVLVPEMCKVRIKSDLLSEADWSELLQSQPNLMAESKEEGDVEITADNVAADRSSNAVADIMECLAGLRYKTDADPMVAFLNYKLGHETSGESLGIHCSDEASGSTVVFLKQIVKEDDIITAVLNIRYPVTADGDRLLGIVEEQARSYGLKMNMIRHLRPVFVPPQAPIIRLLSQAFERSTGEKAELLKMGAGTYARKLKNKGVAFGAGLSGGINTNVHRPDEFVRIEDMMKHAEICLQALYELATADTELA
jgi:succinyl-diaminopimelate desuccinylase